MTIKNNTKKKYLNEYKKTLLYTPYDEFLIEIYENSRPRFKQNKNGKLRLSKRKNYKKIVQEYIAEINNNFNDYINNDEDSLEKIDNTIKGKNSDFSIFNNEKIIKLASKLSEDSWIENDTILLRDDYINIV